MDSFLAIKNFQKIYDHIVTLTDLLVFFLYAKDIISKYFTTFALRIAFEKLVNRNKLIQDCQGFDNDPALVYSLRYLNNCTCVAFL